MAVDPQSRVEASRLLPLSYKLENFVLGENNALAYGAIWEICSGTSHKMVLLVGSCGVGKTFLLKALRRELGDKQKVIYITAENFLNFYTQGIKEKKVQVFLKWVRGVPVLLIDEVSFFTTGNKPQTQAEFISVLKHRIQAGLTTVCAMNSEEKAKLPNELRSLLRSGIVAKIGPVTPSIKRDILLRLAESQHLQKVWSLEECEYLASKLDGDARPVIGVFNAVNLLYQTQGGKGKISRELIEQGLKMSGCGESLAMLSIESINQAVESHFFPICGGGLLQSPSRKMEVVRARQVSMYLMRSLLPDVSLSEIGEFFGKDHSTVLNALKLIEQGGGGKTSEFSAICGSLGVKWQV